MSPGVSLTGFSKADPRTIFRKVLMEMTRRILIPLALVVLVLRFGLSQDVQLVTLVTGLERPVFVTHSGDGSGRLFILEQAGRIRILQAGQLMPIPFLDITGIVEDGGERGLLGLAFHPDFRNNRRYFINYTRTSDSQLQSVIAEYQAGEINPNLSDPLGRILLRYDQPFQNHNGGAIAFGPDGFLYIASGDGGSGGDPQGHGQRMNTLLGKILRIDVDSMEPYAVPPDNPFRGISSVRPEIWALGLRNPWRISFDRLNGRLFAADVGQVTWEEVDIIERGGNYGWRITEGPDCYPTNGPQNCNREGLSEPILFYGREEGTSVTGGYVYRGPVRSRHWGSYIFGDFVSHRIWAARETAPGVWERELLLEPGRFISSFGEDEEGNLYLVDYGGRIHRFEFEELPDTRTYAQLAVGGGFEDILLLSNRSTVSWQGVLQLRRGNGVAWDTPWTLNGEDRSGTDEAVLELGARSSSRIRLGGDSQARAGYLLIQATGDSALADLAVSFFYNFSDEAGLIDSTASLPADFAARYRFPVERSDRVDTGVAAAPFPGFDITQLQWTLYDSQGVLIGTVQRPFEGHSAVFFSEVFPGLPQDFVGLLDLEATQPVALTVLRQELTDNGLQLTTIPAQE